MIKEFDFNADVDNISEISITPAGWVSLNIEYGVAPLGQTSAYQMCWRVQGTSHIFRLPLDVFYENAKDGYEKHFEEILGIFRKDYLSWYKTGFAEEWMQKYKQQFEDLIYTFN